MTKLGSYLITAMLSLLSFEARAQLHQPSESLVSWVEEHVQRYGLPGASVAVIKDYRIKWARGFGLSDRENVTKVNIRTLFQAASVSKSLAAAAAMITFEDNHLNLDDDINVIFEKHNSAVGVGPWRLPNENFSKTPATLRLILSHTAGISSFRYSGYRYGYYKTPPAPIDALPTMRDELNGVPPANTPAIKVEQQPAVHWKYSPAGYTVAQAALMDIYDTDFSSIMTRLLLQPLGMEDSTFAQPVPEALIPRMAVPYVPGGQRLSDGPRVFIASAAGGLTTTSADLAKFVIAFQKALRGETQGYITPRLANEMMTRQPGTIESLDDCLPTSDPHEKACQSSWGLGFDVNVNKYLEHQLDGKPTGGYFAHTGFNSGYLALMLGSKTDGNGIVIMVNIAPEDMTAKSVPQFSFLTDLVRRVADEESWR